MTMRKSMMLCMTFRKALHSFRGKLQVACSDVCLKWRRRGGWHAGRPAKVFVNATPHPATSFQKPIFAVKKRGASGKGGDESWAPVCTLRESLVGH
jgi:hypothetical protein